MTVKDKTIKVGMRVQVVNLDGDKAIGKLIKSGVVNREMFPYRAINKIGTVIKEDIKFAGLFIVTQDEPYYDFSTGRELLRPRGAVYFTTELKELLQLPFDPPVFDDSLVKWIDEDATEK